MDTSDPKHAVDMALAQRKMNQKELAAALGANYTALSRTLNGGQLLDPRSLWGRAFEYLSLEVVIRPKEEK